MKVLLCLSVLLIICTANADIDLVCDENSSYVIWSLYDGSTYLARIFDGFETVSLDEYSNISLSIINSDGSEYLAAACTNIDPWSTEPSYLFVIDMLSLDVLNSRELTGENLGFLEYHTIGDLHLEKYVDGDSCTMISGIGDCTTASGSGDNRFGSCLVDFTDTGSMPLIDTLTTDVSYGYSPPHILGPLDTQQINDLSITGCCCGPGPMNSYFGNICSHLNQVSPAAETEEMWTHVFYSVQTYYEPFELAAVCAGSGASKAVVLWMDTAQVIQCSMFSDSIVPYTTEEFPFSCPGAEHALAMSCNPEDNGILLVWFDHGNMEIRVRHYEDEWNEYDYIVAECSSTVLQENIAVFSVNDGYWIAWLENGASEPELTFIERSTVTGIEDESSSCEPPGAAITLFPNPCNQNLSISPSGISLPGSTRILVHDCSGRLVREIGLEEMERVISWDCCDQSGEQCIHGIYFVTLIGSGFSVTEKALLLD